METRKRSNIVVLTLVGLPLGAVALANVIPPGQQMRRNLYPDRTACERDYTPAQCAQSTTGSGTAYRGYWHGPYYYADRSSAGARSDAGIGRTGGITATQVSMRGGFGAFGRAMHAVG